MSMVECMGKEVCSREKRWARVDVEIRGGMVGWVSHGVAVPQTRSPEQGMGGWLLQRMGNPNSHSLASFAFKLLIGLALLVW